jgi:hypothetical protein
MLYVALAGASAMAQLVGIDLRMQYPSYVTGEPIVAHLKLENHGVQPLVVSDHEAFKDNRVFFEIRRSGDQPLPLMRDSKILADIDLEYGEAMEVKLDLGEWYALLTPDRYYVTAVLVHNNRRYDSEKRVFDVVPGIELARLTQIIRGRSPIERTFTLVYWARGARQDVFLKIVDQPGDEIWSTMGLGSIVRIKKPELKLEDETTITVYHQASRDVLLTSLIRSTAEGPVLVGQQTTVDAVSSPMINTLGDVLEKSKRRTPKRKR